MSLQDWERNGWLQGKKTNPNEIRDLLAVIERDLADSAAEGLSSDWRMNISYNAALQAATMALAAAGYRASRDQHHYRIIQSLRETLGTDAPTVNALDAFRKKRNVAGYDQAGLVSDADAKAMRTLAERLKTDVIRWLQEHHPELLK